MLGPDSCKVLKTFLLLTAQTELKVESVRSRLCSIPSFHPYQAFQRIDRGQRGSIESFDILSYLKDQDCYQFTEAECEKLIEFFDTDND